MAEKKCSRCDLLKPFKDFCKKAQKKDGLASHCRSCAGIYNRKYGIYPLTASKKGV